MALTQNQYDTPTDIIFSSFDTAFTNADSPATLDINTTLVRNGIDGYVSNTGSSRLTFAISEDGTTYGNSINLEAGMTFSLRAISVDSIKITWVADTSYEVFAV
jgi:hypothetical protein